MDNQKKPEMPADDSWFDELLAQPKVGEEINADEHAVNAAGLSDLADMELEQIILETQNMEIPELDDQELALEVIAEEAVEEILADTIEETPVEVAEEILAENTEETPVESAEEITLETTEEIPAQIAEALPVEIIDDIPDAVTDATLVCLPSEPVEETMDATMVHTIEPSEALLWELATADDASEEEEEPRELPETPFLDDEYKSTFGESGESLEMVFTDMSEATEKPAKKERITIILYAVNALGRITAHMVSSMPSHLIAR